MNMHVRDCLRGRLAIRLDDVEPLGFERAPDGTCNYEDCVGEYLSCASIQRPQVGNVLAWHDQSVPNCCWFFGEEGDGTRRVQDTTGWLVSGNNCAKRAF